MVNSLQFVSFFLTERLRYNNAGPGSDNAGPEAIIQVPEVEMHVLGSNNAGPWK